MTHALLMGVVCRLLLHTCNQSMAGVLLRNCGTNILRLMLHVECSFSLLLSGHVDHSLGFSTHHLRTANSGPPLTGRLCKLLPLPPACPLSNKLLRHHLRTLWTPGSQTHRLCPKPSQDLCRQETLNLRTEPRRPEPVIF
ncbi:hypothetical protein CRENBAI_023821 [Crenichthys baileyi]|uniref:Secreted protein n=1 Tax=Crenichthys baileyi TaxID=28760 RepID=A0AAV9S9S6_9TELE